MIIVFGSINMDMIVPVGHFPVPGETVLGTDYTLTPGGKGANQALAACRAGAKTALVSKTGDDGMGQRILAGLRRDGVNTAGVGRSDLPTGMAIIILGPDGENEIIVAPGANNEVTADQMPFSVLSPATLVMTQAEAPFRESLTVLREAKKRGAKTMLNLAPATSLPEGVLPEILGVTDYLVLNDIEARQALALLGEKHESDPVGMAQTFAQRNLTCIVTLGAKGSVAAGKDGAVTRISALKLDNVIDTMGAGDAYCGTLAAALLEGRTLEDAMRRGSVAGSLACTKKGAQESYAYLGEIEASLSALGA